MRTITSLFLALIAFPLSAETFNVTRTADTGAGSLRQAILDANASSCAFESRCQITFAIPGPVPSSGWFTIAPTSPLPIIQQSWVSIDGATQTAFTGDTNPNGPEIEIDGSSAGYRSGLKVGAAYGVTIEGLCVNRFEGHGIFLEGAGGAVIARNYVGVDPAGTEARANGFNGIALRDVGGTRIEANLVSGNAANGIYAIEAKGIYVLDNRVGLGREGYSAIPNGAHGIDVRGTAVIADNTVAFNKLHGIAMAGDVSLSNNESLGNGLLNFASWPLPVPSPVEAPVLTAALENSRTSGYYTGFPVVTGRVHAPPSTQVFLAAYVFPRLGANGPEGEPVTIGGASVSTDANGDATFTIDRGYHTTELDLFGGYVVATATVEGKPRSAFSQPIPLAITTPTFEVTTTADGGPGSLRQAIEGANASQCTLDDPCRIAFNVPPSTLLDGVARIALASPLPAVRGYVRFTGGSQRWWHGDTNPDGPEIEIRGGTGLRFGTAEEPAIRTYVDSVVINGSASNGLAIHTSSVVIPNLLQARVRVTNVYSGTDARGMVAVPNFGNGLRIDGGTPSAPIFDTQTNIVDCVFSGNNQNGVLLGGEAHTFARNRIGTNARGTAPLPNQGHGFYVIGGTRHRIEGNEIAFNGADGVATVKGVRAPTVISAVHDNGGLGIDVNDDGVSAPDGNNEDGTIDPPVIQRAWYDAAEGVTWFEGTAHPAAYPMTPTFGLAGEAFGNYFFVSDAPDPSGFGEGARSVGDTYPPLKAVEGTQGSFRIGVRGDLRGKWLTGTTNRFYCYWEAGCHPRETSEFSKAFPVQ